jgi:phospholipid/cholesterol/gamma-HCH transport system substrate-binding protein
VSGVPVHSRRGLTPLTVGLILIVLSIIGVFFAFTKKNPLREHYEISAVVQTSNLLAKGSVVRIAGIDVGKITNIERYKNSSNAKITMKIDPAGRPVRKDASLKIRPRLFLEGNFFVELEPGEPNSPELENGGTIPLSATAVPVQMDQFFSSLRADTRKALQETVDGLGDGLGGTPSAADDAGQDPAVVGLSGGQALNRTLDTSADSLRGGAIVAEALQGQNRGDLAKLFKGVGDVTSKIAAADPNLLDLVRNLNGAMEGLGRNDQALSATVEKLGLTAQTGRTAFTAFNQAIPPLRGATKDLTRAMEVTPGVVEASTPWLRQAKPLLSDAERGGLLDDLSPATRNLAKLTRESRRLVPATSDFSQCMNDVFLPTGMIKVQDGIHTVDVPNYKEFWYALTGMAGNTGTFDGNGQMMRVQAIGGATPVKTGWGVFTGLPAFGNLTQPSTGTSPAFTGKEPPLRRDVRCADNPVPDINGSASQGPGDGSKSGAPAPPVNPTNRPGASR